MVRYPARSAAFAITLLGSIINLSFTLQTLASWSSLKEPESNETEWDSSWLSRKWPWHPDGIHLMGGFLLAYFSTAAAVSIVGFVGTVQRKATLLKFYRDSSIADLSLCVLVALIGIYFAWLPQTNVRVCEGLSQQPELMRDLYEFGLSPENCERWCNRAVVALLVVMILSIVAKLHFVLAVEIYYSHLARIPRLTVEQQNEYAELQVRAPGHGPLRRIFIARGPEDSSADSNSLQDEEMVVYTRIPPEHLPWRTTADARREATARWVTGMASQSPPRNLSPPSSPSLGSSDSGHGCMTGSGQVRLPIEAGEGLFPLSQRT
ncbi:hypothetical protein E1B28_004771 [Marasmius oreades]|uniref:Uncharacterized protein n=1 Tax=Marasmius oreades TaxID=181124 RepID=A0A9P7UZC9_9AGAR|nr:uncharacterized protein E1B28_004771 [Marasmius oreades]KAG7097427.1 hypothetical protein E1B28_004771 [Marasmius oreades]